MERRRLTRPRLRINIRARSGDAALGHVRDITDHGLCLSGRGSAPQDQHQLILCLPWPLDGRRELALRVQPCWQTYDKNGHWRAGFRLMPDEETATTLATLASRYGDR